MAALLTVISWRSIPAQVVAKEGRTTVRVQLPDRFQEAIDGAALQAGLIGTDDYLGEWRRTSRACGPDLDQEAHAEADRLDEAFTPTVLDQYVRTGGVAPEDEA